MCVGMPESRCDPKAFGRQGGEWVAGSGHPQVRADVYTHATPTFPYVCACLSTCVLNTHVRTLTRAHVCTHVHAHVYTWVWRFVGQHRGARHRRAETRASKPQ